jgi:hypothetical protein
LREGLDEMVSPSDRGALVDGLLGAVDVDVDVHARAAVGKRGRRDEADKGAGEGDDSGNPLHEVELPSWGMYDPFVLTRQRRSRRNLARDLCRVSGR